MDETYKVVRKFFHEYPDQVIHEGLSLEEARKICRDPESTSRTCTDPDLVMLTDLCGPWFDGYSEE